MFEGATRGRITCFNLFLLEKVNVSCEEFDLERHLIGLSSKYLKDYLNCEDILKKEELLILLKRRAKLEIPST
jgi:hypothetical protein